MCVASSEPEPGPLLEPDVVVVVVSSEPEPELVDPGPEFSESSEPDPLVPDVLEASSVTGSVAVTRSSEPSPPGPE